MRSIVKFLGILSISSLLFSFPAISHAATQAIPKVEDGMKQGDFALWLVHAIGAVKVQESGPIIQQAGRVPGHLPPGVRPNDAIQFLWGNLGVQVDGDWKKKEPMTKEKLLSILKGYDLNNDDKSLIEKLSDPNNTAGDIFQKIADVVKKYVKESYLNLMKAVFRVTPSPFVPAG